MKKINISGTENEMIVSQVEVRKFLRCSRSVGFKGFHICLCFFSHMVINRHELSVPLCVPFIIFFSIAPNCTVSHCIAVGGRIVSYLIGGCFI